jgi:hypothetical protein
MGRARPVRPAKDLQHIKKIDAKAFLWPQLPAYLGQRDSRAGGRTLHKAFVIVPLLGWAGVAVLVYHTRYSPAHQANEGTVVVVPPRSVEAAGRTPVPQQPPRVIPPPGDRAALVRELHKELARVGCYESDISGVWTSSSRRAMRAFTDRVNAKLPTDEPDYILLSLVQGHRRKACGTPCPGGQQDDPDGRCVPSAMAAGAAKKPTPDARAELPADRAPLITGSATTAAAIAAAVPAPERSAAPPPARPAHAQPSTADGEPAQRSVRQSGPVPHVGMRERRRRHAARRANSRPPAAVRSLVRTVKRTLGSFGIR